MKFDVRESITSYIPGVPEKNVPYKKGSLLTEEHFFGTPCRCFNLTKLHTCN